MLFVAQEAVCQPNDSGNKSVHEEGSILQHVLKLLIKLQKDSLSPNGKIDKSVELCFEILRNESLLCECRTILWKVSGALLSVVLVVTWVRVLFVHNYKSIIFE